MGLKNALGHNNISQRELLCLAPIIDKDCGSRLETVNNLQLIDDLLGIKKLELLIISPRYTKSGMLRKEQRMTINKALEDRIEAFLEI